MSNKTVFYELFIHFSDENDKLLYVGTDRKLAQDYVSRLEKAEAEEGLSPLSFSLKEIITVSGVVIRDKYIDI